MNHYTFPLTSDAPDPANEINRLTDEFLENFKISGKNLSNRSWHKLSQILDFVEEAEQTIAQQNARIERLEALTTTDSLTGLLNRRGICRELEQAVSRSERHGEHGLFVYIDLDDFKQVNDNYGHEAGDETLRYLGEILRSSIRQTDYAARMGGDEFALLLTHSDREGSKCRTQFIQQQLNFAKCLYQGHNIPIRASFGISEISPGKSISEIIKMADSQMFRNKAARAR